MGGALVAAWGLSACGGDAESDGSGSSGGAAGAGASGVGGSGASGVGGSGASGVGGSGTAGTVGVGGSGTAGTGGVGGVGGAGGTGGALPEEWFACSDTSQCAVRRNECCELCGPETTGEALAYNVAHGTELEAALCENEPGGCPDIACELAPQWILPLCTSGRCKALDIREDLLTSCGDNQPVPAPVGHHVLRVVRRRDRAAGRSEQPGQLRGHRVRNDGRRVSAVRAAPVSPERPRRVRREPPLRGRVRLRPALCADDERKCS